MGALEDIIAWRDLVGKNAPPEPKITQIRIYNGVPGDKVMMVGRHAYMSDYALQSIMAEKKSAEDVDPIARLSGIPILRSWVPEEFCATCGWNEFEVKNYSLIWHDGDLCCTKCGTKLRDWDAE